jgi:hypothetical protein
MDRIFDEAQLAEMGKRTLDRVLEAIAAGDAAEASRLAQRMYNEFTGMHDLYRDWLTGTLSAIGRRYGDEALEDIMTDGIRAWWTPLSRSLPRGPEHYEQRVKMFVAGLRGHLQPMDIVEDDEKIEIRMKPCGSGGRQIAQGRYEGADGFLKVAQPQRMTYGRPDVPVYCTHEIAMERVDVENDGHPFVITEPAAELGKGYCRLLLYKNPKDIPERYYTRLGLTKPQVPSPLPHAGEAAGEAGG